MAGLDGAVRSGLKTHQGVGGIINDLFLEEALAACEDTLTRCVCACVYENPSMVRALNYRKVPYLRYCILKKSGGWGTKEITGNLKEISGFKGDERFH